MMNRTLICAALLLCTTETLAAQVEPKSGLLGGRDESSFVSEIPTGSKADLSRSDAIQDSDSPLADGNRPRIPKNDYLNQEPDRSAGGLDKIGKVSGSDQSFDQDNLAVGRIADGKLFLDNCTIQFIEDIEVPARESGQIVRLDVKEGDPVKANQLLAQLDDTMFRILEKKAQLSYENAKIKAEDQSAILAEEKGEQLAEVKLRRTSLLHSRGSANDAELETAQFEYQLAVLKIQVAKNTQKAAAGEARIEMAQIDEAKQKILRHQMFVDFDGYVVELLKHKLEWVSAGEPVMRVARMDRLAVQAIVSTKIANPFQIRKGQNVVVTLQLAGGQTEQFNGTVSNVALERETGTLIKIKAEVENRKIGSDAWLLQPLSVVEMVVSLD
jgi:hypothetical protein